MGINAKRGEMHKSQVKDESRESLSCGPAERTAHADANGKTACDNEESNSESGAHQIISKRPYSKPTLTVYGSVRDLTKANFTTGQQDNPTNARLHTAI